MNNLRLAGICEAVLIILLLSACLTATPTQSAQNLLAPQALTGEPCDACAQATLITALTQDKNNVDNQAVATAEIVRANAQATLGSANATLNAVQTQDQNSANALAAQIAATAEIVRANAQATLNAAGSTQSAALTQDAIRQTQVANIATTGAESILAQQNKDALAASTQTAIANNIATQTQSAAATSQWYADQDRQRAEQRKGPLAFLWTLCLSVFFILFAGLVLWGVWRWLRIQQSNQRILENPVAKLQPPHNDPPPYVESEIVDSHYQLTNPDDQVGQWMDEVKDKLRNDDKKDEDDNTEK